MKILAINSSHRGDNGYTRFLIDKLFQGANDAGSTCEVVTLAKLKINPCTGCQRCHTEAHSLHCIYDEKDDVQTIFEKMKSADIIVFATPVYIFSMSGLMKVFLDRLNSTGNSNELKVSKSGLFFHHINSEICSKPFVTLVCCDNMENETVKNVRSYFKTYAKFMDANQVGEIVRRLGKLTGHGKNAELEKKYPKILDVYAALYEAGKELAVTGKISRSTQKRTNQNTLSVPLIGKVLIQLPFFKRTIFEKRIKHQNL